MKRFILICFLLLGMVGCATKLPPHGNKVAVQSERPQVVQVDQSLDKTKILVRNSQELIDQVSQLSLDNKTLADQLKAQNTTPLNSPVIDKLIVGLNQTTTELFKVKVELRDAYDELEKNKANVAVLNTKIDVQSKELLDRTEKFNQEVANEEVIRTALAKEKVKVQEETDRANGWRKKFWWVFSALLIWLALKVAKVAFKVGIPFI